MYQQASSTLKTAAGEVCDCKLSAIDRFEKVSMGGNVVLFLLRLSVQQ